ncbi:Uncharacterised protein [Mycolicibacterium phlei]|nr:Uncharacterised protein [Mycolicibacterium phlei]
MVAHRSRRLKRLVPPHRAQPRHPAEPRARPRGLPGFRLPDSVKRAVMPEWTLPAAPMLPLVQRERRRSLRRHARQTQPLPRVTALLVTRRLPRRREHSPTPNPLPPANPIPRAASRLLKVPLGLLMRRNHNPTAKLRAADSASRLQPIRQQRAPTQPMLTARQRPNTSLIRRRPAQMPMPRRPTEFPAARTRASRAPLKLSSLV